MDDAVVLEYKRASGELSTGRVYLRVGPNEVDELKFEELEFKKMLALFAEKLREFRGTEAVWQRTDRPGLVPYTLDAAVTTLFREDPVAAIASMCPPSRSPSSTVSYVREERAVREGQRISVSVRAGYDALADSFGDQVASRSRRRSDGLASVECPCCGIWSLVQNGASNCINTRCRAFDKALAIHSPNAKWSFYQTADLLETGAPRFYLPRAWNNGCSWVSWETLSQKYNEFQKEKKAWLCQVRPA